MSAGKVFVTGANSLLGTNVIISLLREGYDVTGLVRDPAFFNCPIRNCKLHIVKGDISDPGTYDKYLDGIDYLIHIAAATGQNVIKYSYYKKINVSATGELIETAIKKNIKKFIYVSSANTFAFGSEESPGDETRPACKPVSDSYYARSKREAQDLVVSYKDKIDVVILNPTFMLGPYDSKPSSGRIIMMGYGKKLIFYPPGGKNFIHVGDAAQGVVSAIKYGVNGESYLLSGHNMSYKEFFASLARQTGAHSRQIKIPRVLLIGAGYLGNILKAMGINNDFLLTNMRILCINNFYTNRKAVKELGLRTRPIDVAIKDSLGWFKESGMIADI